MNKLVSMLLAGGAALALTGGAYAADNTTEPGRDSGGNVQNQTQGAPVNQAGKDANNTEGREAPRDPSSGQTAGTVNEGNKDVTTEGRDPKKDAYQAELKKCDSMSASEKKTCTDAAKKKHGQM